MKNFVYCQKKKNYCAILKNVINFSIIKISKQILKINKT